MVGRYGENIKCVLMGSDWLTSYKNVPTLNYGKRLLK